MSLRRDEASGIITCAFGVIMAGFAGFGLLIVGLQHLVLSATPQFPQDGAGLSVDDAIRIVHGVLLIYLPLMIAGGIVFAVAGFYLRRGSIVARRVAQANAVLGYVWLAAYMISYIRISDCLVPPVELLPVSAGNAMQWVSLVVGTLFFAACPTALLLILRRPRDESADELPTATTRPVT